MAEKKESLPKLRRSSRPLTVKAREEFQERMKLREERKQEIERKKLLRMEAAQNLKNFDEYQKQHNMKIAEARSTTYRSRSPLNRMKREDEVINPGSHTNKSRNGICNGCERTLGVGSCPHCINCCSRVHSSPQQNALFEYFLSNEKGECFWCFQERIAQEKSNVNRSTLEQLRPRTYNNRNNGVNALKNINKRSK